MRIAPQWFQDELQRIGGTNPYGDPIYRLAWSPEEKMVIGGRWAGGFEGYKQVPAITGPACWALMIWEPREMQGSAEAWETEYRDPETGFLQCGGYPRNGRYRLLKKFMHREVTYKTVTEPVWINHVLKFQKVRKPELETFRIEPTGLILDLLLPMLMLWRKLSGEAKLKATLEEEERKEAAFLKTAKDIRDGNRVRRGSQLVAKRAELIEKGFEQAMKMAARTGLGMRMETI